MVGLINAAFLLSAGALSLPLGLVVHRLGMKLLAGVGLLILAASSFLLAVSSTPHQLLWIYLFSGAGLAAFGPTTMSYVAGISPPTHLGRSYGWYTTALYVGMSLGPAAGGFVAEAWGFSPVFILSGLSIFVTFWLMFFFLPRARHVMPASPSQPAMGVALIREVGEKPAAVGLLAGHRRRLLRVGRLYYLPALACPRAGVDLRADRPGLCRPGRDERRLPPPLRTPERPGETPHPPGDLGASRGGGLSGRIHGFPAAAPFHPQCRGHGNQHGPGLHVGGGPLRRNRPPEHRAIAMGGYNSAIYLGMMVSAAGLGPIIGLIGYKDGFLLTTLITVLITGIAFLLMKGFLSARARSVG